MAVLVDYTGRLIDGTEFDSSKGKNPIEFMLGDKKVIPGWEEGILGMKVGGSRRLIIPAELGYGDAGAGKLIPPGATLEFDTTLVDAKKVEGYDLLVSKIPGGQTNLFLGIAFVGVGVAGYLGLI